MNSCYLLYLIGSRFLWRNCEIIGSIPRSSHIVMGTAVAESSTLPSDSETENVTWVFAIIVPNTDIPSLLSQVKICGETPVLQSFHEPRHT